MKTRMILWLVALAAVVGTSGPAHALNGTSMGAGISFTNTLGATDYGDNPMGWAFTPLTNITITHLGFFDTQADGLATSHDVAIYPISSSTPLVSGTVPAGTAGLLIGDGAANHPSYYGGYWRYTDVADTLLLSNTTYVVAAHPEGDGTPTSPGSNWALFENHPWITLGDSYFISSTTLVNPAVGGVNVGPLGSPNGYPSPNFLILPEPSSLMLLGVGAILLWRRRGRAE